MQLSTIIFFKIMYPFPADLHTDCWLFAAEVPADMFQKTETRAGKPSKRCPEVSWGLSWENIRR